MLATEALALRVGDVSRDSGPDAPAQSGEAVHVDKASVGKGTSYQDEVENAVVLRGEDPVDSEKSKQVHIGEQNIFENHSEFKDGKFTHTITVNDGSYAPKCTQKAIKDHLGELASAPNGDFAVEVKFDMPWNDSVKKEYNGFRAGLERGDGKETGESKYPNVQIEYPWDKEG